MSKVTLVTGLWDIGRGNLNEGWSRSYSTYLDKFKQLLSTDLNLIIFGDIELQQFVSEHRSHHNTQFNLRDLDWFKNNDYYPLIQKIRTNPEWFNQTGWLTDSTQAKLEMYNPLVMSKMFLLHDAKIMDRFNSDYLFWIDAGITNTVHQGYFTHDKVIEKLPNIINKFTFLSFPYEANTEIHGFEYKKLCEYAGDKVNKVSRGGFFGGPKHTITDVNSIYYHLMIDTLSKGYMGTEESLFTIMTYKNSDLVDFSLIKENGFVSHFFEEVKNASVNIKTESKTPQVSRPIGAIKVGLYVIGFNSPNQFQTLIDSMLEYDKNFIERPRKILLDNSTDLSTTPYYSEICEKYRFEHIKKDNLGICGGRQWIAEHFNQSDLDYMFFFEDDMFFYPKKGELCRNGFNRFVDGLYEKSIQIIQKENLDFLKLNFSEFYGDNSTQWSWYNVPQSVRETIWPKNNKLPEQGLDPNAPRTKFEVIKTHVDVPYALGEVYYCNWPQVVAKDGNKKMFLETTWARPFEQTWMSHIYQETVRNKIKSGILLLTPTEHNRFDHYSKELRKES